MNGQRAIAAFLLWAGTVSAQVTTATFYGIVSDRCGLAWERFPGLGPSPFLMRNSSRSSNPDTLPLLAWWFFPGLLFYAIVHVGDPDHTLSIVPATCVAGAVVLTTLTRRASRAKTALVISICVLLNFGLFIKPINKTA